MARKTKKIILITAIAIIAVTAVTGYMLWNKPHKNVKDADAVKITAVDLYNSFITDSAKANTLYTDKVVLVVGEVSQVFSKPAGAAGHTYKNRCCGAFINCTMEGKSATIKQEIILPLKESAVVISAAMQIWACPAMFF